MDPLSTLARIYSAVDWMYTLTENMIANAERCRRLFERANMIKSLLQQNFPQGRAHHFTSPLAQAISRTSDTITEAVQLISSFTNDSTDPAEEGRGFFRRAKSSLKQISKVVYNKDWEDQFAELSRQLSMRISDLNLVLQVKSQTDFSVWAKENERDREQDAKSLRASLSALEANSQSLSHQMRDLNDEMVLAQHQVKQQQASMQEQLDLILQALAAQITNQSAGSSAAASTSTGSPSLRTTSSVDSEEAKPRIDPRLTTPLWEVEFGPLLRKTRTSQISLGTWRYHNVVVKLCAQSWTPEVRENFFREVEISSLLRSPFITQIYAACFEEGRACLVLEHVRGGSLRDRIALDGRPSTEYAVQVSLDVIAGLAYLHDMGFWHRDLRSSKILLDDLGRAKLCDFSTAKDTRSRLDFARGTLQATVAPPAEDCRWMAPEVFADFIGAFVPGAYPRFVEATASSDVFSLGVVLFELFSGSEPYSTTPTAELLIPKLADDRPFLEKNALPADVAPVVVDLIRRCTLQVPGTRPHLSTLLHTMKQLQESKTPSPYLAMLPRDICSASGAQGAPFSHFRTVFFAAQAASKAADFQTAASLYKLVVQSGDLFYAPRAASDFALLTFRQMTATADDFNSAIRLLEYAAHLGYPRAWKILIVKLLEGCPALAICPDVSRAQHWLQYAEFSNDADLPKLKAQALQVSQASSS